MKTLTLDEIRNLPAYERTKAMRDYQAWRDEKRKKNKLDHKRKQHRDYARIHRYKLKAAEYDQ